MANNGMFSKARTLARVTIGLSALLGTLLPGVAQAGRRPYFWTYDTEVVPERGAEVETWLTERFFDKGNDQAQIWSAPIIGLTDRVELVIPFEWSYWEAKKATQFDWYGAELRIRLSDPDREVSGPFSALVRVGVYRPVRVRPELRFETNLVGRYEFSERCQATADVGAVALKNGPNRIVTYAAATSCKAIGDLRLGGEMFGELFFGSPVDQPSLTMVGPNFGFTHGRTWLAGGILFGVTDSAPVAMSRLIWAISF